MSLEMCHLLDVVPKKILERALGFDRDICSCDYFAMLRRFRLA